MMMMKTTVIQMTPTNNHPRITTVSAEEVASAPTTNIRNSKSLHNTCN